MNTGRSEVRDLKVINGVVVDDLLVLRKCTGCHQTYGYRGQRDIKTTGVSHIQRPLAP
jgi:hypothetical protein